MTPPGFRFVKLLSEIFRQSFLDFLQLQLYFELVAWFLLRKSKSQTSIHNDCLETSWFEVSCKQKSFNEKNYAIKNKLWELFPWSFSGFSLVSLQSCFVNLYFSYINYSNIAAKLLRRSLKKEFRADADKRDVTSIKFTPWVNGKPIRKYQHAQMTATSHEINEKRDFKKIQNENETNRHN